MKLLEVSHKNTNITFCFDLICILRSFSDFHQSRYPYDRVLFGMYLQYRFLPPSLGFEPCACAVIGSVVEHGLPYGTWHERDVHRLLRHLLNLFFLGW